jgi:hypothetical protein
LLPIFVILSVFMYFIDSRILSLTRTSLSDSQRRNWRHYGDETSSDSDSDNNEVKASTPSTYSTDLLDGFIEDIQIQPLSPEVMAPPLDENVPPKSGWLVDDLAEDVRTTTLELKVSSTSPCYCRLSILLTQLSLCSVLPVLPNPNTFPAMGVNKSPQTQRRKPSQPPSCGMERSRGH